MGKVIFSIMVLCFLSCTKKESSSDILLRNQLKEAIKLYKDIGSISEEQLRQKEEEEGYKRKGSDSLRMVQAKFTALFEKSKITNKGDLLRLKEKLYTEFNKLYPYHNKYKCYDSEGSKLTDLDVNIVKLYVECNFNKTQYENLEWQGREWCVVDGIHIINPSQVKQIEALEIKIREVVKSKSK